MRDVPGICRTISVGPIDTPQRLIEMFHKANSQTPEPLQEFWLDRDTREKIADELFEETYGHPRPRNKKYHLDSLLICGVKVRASEIVR